MSGLFTLVVIAHCAGCERSESSRENQGDRASPLDLPLLEPEVKKPNLAHRCAAQAGAMPSTLRAADDGGSGKVPVEVGMGVPVAEGYAVSGLTSGSETSAFVFFTDGRGREKKVDLGRVHGAVEAPLLAVFGSHVLVAVVDNDAMNTRIRLAKISQISSAAQVTWGPEVQATRDESTTLSLAYLPGGTAPRALLVWDNFDRSSSRSRIEGLWFSPESMKATGLPHTLSASDQDVVEPRVRARNSGGAWITWLAYGKMNTDRGPRDVDAPLVSEPPRWLEARKMGPNDAKWGTGIRVSPENERVLAYDSGSLGDDLVIVYRGERPGDTSESTPLDLRVVAQDGSVKQSSVQDREIGPGAPLILSSDSSHPTWLVTKGQDLELLWGIIDGSGTVSDLREETVLEGQIPLTRDGDMMLLMKPQGLDLQLSAWRCQGEPKQTAPAASSSP